MMLCASVCLLNRGLKIKKEECFTTSSFFISIVYCQSLAGYSPFFISVCILSTTPCRSAA